MNKDLLESVERLRIASDKGMDCIDDRLETPRLRQQKRQSPDELKAKLEADFLTSPTIFGPEWLNKFQR